MKKIYLAAGLLPVMALAISSCEGNYDDRYPQEYHNVIKFKETDQQPITLYSTETEQVYNFIVNRGGTNQADGAVHAHISVMSEADFRAYTEEYGFTYYSQVPTDCYNFGSRGEGFDVTFEAGQTYVTDSLLINVAKTHAFMETLPYTQTPVIPLMVSSDDATVREMGQYVFLVPSYMEPELGLAQHGLVRKTITPAEAVGTETINLAVELPVVNKWNFGFTLAVSEDLLNKVNKANNTAYAMMDETMYSGIVSPFQEFSFTPGSTKTNVAVTINLEKLPMSSVALPIEITGINGLNIDVDPSASGVVYGYTISLIDSYTTNDPEPSEGPLDDLFDGNKGTFFHSAWSTAATADTHHPTYGSYIQFNLAAELTKVGFNFTTRSGNNNGAPDVVACYVSSNGSDWTKIGQQDNLLSVLTGGGVSAQIGPFTADAPFKYVRFCVLKSKAGALTEPNKAYWNGSELELLN